MQMFEQAQGIKIKGKIEHKKNEPTNERNEKMTILASNKTIID